VDTAEIGAEIALGAVAGRDSDDCIHAGKGTLIAIAGDSQWQRIISGISRERASTRPQAAFCDRTFFTRITRSPAQTVRANTMARRAASSIEEIKAGFIFSSPFPD
jgi:hypothetical protein